MREPVEPETLTHVIDSPCTPNMRIVRPTPETIAELCGAVEAAIYFLGGERPWQPCDAFPPDESGTFVVARP